MSPNDELLTGNFLTVDSKRNRQSHAYRPASFNAAIVRNLHVTRTLKEQNHLRDVLILPLLGQFTTCSLWRESLILKAKAEQRDKEEKMRASDALEQNLL